MWCTNCGAHLKGQDRCARCGALQSAARPVAASVDALPSAGATPVNTFTVPQPATSSPWASPGNPKPGSAAAVAPSAPAQTQWPGRSPSGYHDPGYSGSSEPTEERFTRLEFVLMGLAGAALGAVGTFLLESLSHSGGGKSASRQLTSTATSTPTPPGTQSPVDLVVYTSQQGSRVYVAQAASYTHYTYYDFANENERVILTESLQTLASPYYVVATQNYDDASSGWNVYYWKRSIIVTNLLREQPLKLPAPPMLGLRSSRETLETLYDIRVVGTGSLVTVAAAVAPAASPSVPTIQYFVPSDNLYWIPIPLRQNPAAVSAMRLGPDASDNQSNAVYAAVWYENGSVEVWLVYLQSGKEPTLLTPPGGASQTPSPGV